MMFKLMRIGKMLIRIELVCAAARLRVVGNLSLEGYEYVGHYLKWGLLLWIGDCGCKFGQVNVGYSV